MIAGHMSVPLQGGGSGRAGFAGPELFLEVDQPAMVAAEPVIRGGLVVPGDHEAPSKEHNGGQDQGTILSEARRCHGINHYPASQVGQTSTGFMSCPTSYVRLTCHKPATSRLKLLSSTQPMLSPSRTQARAEATRGCKVVYAATNTGDERRTAQVFSA